MASKGGYVWTLSILCLCYLIFTVLKIFSYFSSFWSYAGFLVFPVSQCYEIFYNALVEIRGRTSLLIFLVVVVPIRYLHRVTFVIPCVLSPCFFLWF